MAYTTQAIQGASTNPFVVDPVTLRNNDNVALDPAPAAGDSQIPSSGITAGALNNVEEAQTIRTGDSATHDNEKPVHNHYRYSQTSPSGNSENFSGVAQGSGSAFQPSSNVPGQIRHSLGGLTIGNNFTKRTH